MNETDTLSLKCPYCDDYDLSEQVAHGVHQRPSTAVAWYDRMSRHILRRHVGRPETITKKAMCR